MSTHHDIEQLCNDAEHNRRCFYPATNTQRQAVQTRIRNGYLTRPFRNMYARNAYWQSLNPIEQAQHIIRTLSGQFPTRIFAGLSAATIMQLDHNWSLHEDNTVFIAKPTGPAQRSNAAIKHVTATNPPLATLANYRNSDGLQATIFPGRPEMQAMQQALQRQKPCEITSIIPITSPARTLVDCGLRYSFSQALPMFDSAVRQKLVTAEQITDICDGLRVDCGRVLRLVYYMDPLSENGGESLCRAVIIEAGFVVPDLQHVFIDPDAPWKEYRVDFVWYTPDGRIIILEFDGTAKYVDPAMTNRRSIQAVVHSEKERENVLQRAGASSIIRTNFDEVIQRTPLIQKLLDAGVPMAGFNPVYEKTANWSGRL